jgi:hypothetical protein
MRLDQHYAEMYPKKIRKEKLAFPNKPILVIMCPYKAGIKRHQAC